MKSTFVLSCLLAALAMTCAQLMTGGVNPTTRFSNFDPEVVFAMTSVNDHFDNLNDVYNRTLVTIVSASTQVVRGVMYRFTLEVSGNPRGNEVCDMSVWSQPWLSNPFQAGAVTCQSKQAYEETKAALAAFERYTNSRLYNMFYLRVKNQPDVVRQTVDGEDQFVLSNVRLAYTVCTRATAFGITDADQLAQGCPVTSYSRTQMTCTATVVKDGDVYRVTSSTC